jgi:excisionase family DNA binding protein
MNNPFEILENKLSDMQALLMSFIDSQNNNNKSESDIHFNVEELAIFLRCSKSTIYKYIDEGLPSFGTGRTRLFSKREVLDYMRKSKGKNKQTKKQ